MMSTNLVKAEGSNNFFRSKTVQYEGENNNWKIEYQMTLNGTEIVNETKIIYKGLVNHSIASSTIHFLISDRQLNTLGGGFTLNHSGQIYRIKRECLGCTFIEKEKELTCEIYGKNGIEQFKLFKIEDGK
jgi:hypothetical protein